MGSGTALGVALGESRMSGPWPEVIVRFFELGGFIGLAWLQALAVPLIFSSLLLGGVGLEPMRRMGTLAGKTLVWIVGSVLLAVLVAFVVTFLVAPAFDQKATFTERVGLSGWPETLVSRWGWLGLVLVSFAFGYFRNQIDEGYGRMLTRFCQGIEAMLVPVLPWTESVIAVSIFCLATSITATCGFQVRSLSDFDPIMIPGIYERSAVTLLLAAVVYMLALSLAVWSTTRVNPWRCLRSLASAMLLAACGQSVEAALPLTMDAMRRDAGVSNRVAGVVLSLCASLHRDGIALGWAAVTLCLYSFHPITESWTALACIALAAVVMGCGLSAMSAKSGLVPFLFLSLSGWRHEAQFTFVLGCFIVVVGNAISVFSHACATVIIARGEGEYWVPGPPPDPDELQGLKNDLELAEG